MNLHNYYGFPQMTSTTLHNEWTYLFFSDDPGTYGCSSGSVFYIKSTNFPYYPPGYPLNTIVSWEFMVSIVNIMRIIHTNTRHVYRHLNIQIFNTSINVIVLSSNKDVLKT